MIRNARLISNKALFKSICCKWRHITKTASVQLIKLKYMEYENDIEEEKELSDITVFYSSDLNLHFTPGL